MSGKRKDRSFTQTDVFGAICGQQPRIGPEEKAKIRRLSSAGASLEHIAAAWEVQLDEVKQILEECSSSEGVADEVVKRLLKDPEELCCPVSHQLMADPVVAADGLTYERSWVEECLRKAPHKSPTTGEAMSTTVLLPNQTLKSMILSFKEQTVNEILSLIPRVAKHQVPELAKRGEDFVRPLPDASAKRKLAQLLLLRVKHGTDCGEVAKELVALLSEAKDEGVAQAVVATLSSMSEHCQRLEVSRKELEERCRKLETDSALLSAVWDLSSYDFSDFKKGQEQRSEKFQLPCGINAWMELCPKGHANSSEGKAGLFLFVDKPAAVKWTMQSGLSEAKTVEHDFSKDLTSDGKPRKSFGWRNFMPISEAKGRVALRILSIQLPNSSLCFP